MFRLVRFPINKKDEGLIAGKAGEAEMRTHASQSWIVKFNVFNYSAIPMPSLKNPRIQKMKTVGLAAPKIHTMVLKV